MDGQAREEPLEAWSPSPGWTRLGVAIGITLRWMLILTTFVACVFAASSAGLLLFSLLMLVVFPVATAVHELGHYVAARRHDMTVLLMRIGAVDIAPWGRGWRLRWKRYIHPLPAGYVYALPDPSRPCRLPMIVFALGGVIATLIFATLVALAVPLMPTASGRSLLIGCVAILFLPTCNLFPGRDGYERDGPIAWRWWRHPPDIALMAPVLAKAKLLRGTPISELETRDADALMDESITGVWYAVKRHQQRGEWEQAVECGPKLEGLVPAHRFARSAYAEAIDAIRAEIAFAAAVLHGDPALLPDAAALDRCRWGDPALSPRCAAWAAYRAGDHGAWRDAMALTMRLASRSADRSLLASERLIAGQLYDES
jgi:hypothetical protein